MSNKDRMIADMALAERKEAKRRAEDAVRKDKLWKCHHPGCGRRGTIRITVGKKDTLWCARHEPEPFSD